MAIDKQRSTFWQVLDLAYSLGITIAIPLVVFALIGRWLDKTYSTSPLFLLIGIIVSLIATTIALYRKMAEFQKTLAEADGEQGTHLRQGFGGQAENKEQNRATGNVKKAE